MRVLGAAAADRIEHDQDCPGHGQSLTAVAPTGSRLSAAASSACV
jgi:hypothetical protein